MRSVFLPPEAAVFEVTGSFELGKCAAVLFAWAVGALILSLVFFRWNKRGQD